MLDKKRVLKEFLILKRLFPITWELDWMLEFLMVLKKKGHQVNF